MDQGYNFVLVVPIIPLQSDYDNNFFDFVDDADTVPVNLSKDRLMYKYSLVNWIRGDNNTSSSGVTAQLPTLLVMGLVWITAPMMDIFETLR